MGRPHLTVQKLALNFFIAVWRTREIMIELNSRKPRQETTENQLFPARLNWKKWNVRCFFNPMNILQTFYRNQVSLGSDLLVRLSLTHSATFCWLNWCNSSCWRYQLNTNLWWAIQGNVAICWPILQLIQVAPSCGHASNTTWWPKLEPMQVALLLGTNAGGILLPREILKPLAIFFHSYLPLQLQCKYEY